MIDLTVVESVVDFIRSKWPGSYASDSYGFVDVRSPDNDIIVTLFFNDIGVRAFGTDYEIFYSDPLFFDKVELLICERLSKLTKFGMIKS